MKWRNLTKEEYIFVVASIAAIVIGVLLSLSGVGDTSVATTDKSDATASAATAVPFAKIVQGERSSVTTRTNYRITSADQMNDLWKLLDGAGTPPTIDFSTHEVIAVFAGKQSSTSIAVARIEDADTRTISIVVNTCVKKASTASPYEVIVVPSTSLSLAHEDVTTTANCTN